MPDPLTTPVAPFNPLGESVPRNGPGCSKPMVVGCLVLVLLAGLTLMAAMAPSFIRWSFHKIETSLAPRLPADLSAAERARLHRAFSDAADTAAGGRGDFASIRRFQDRMLTIENGTGQLSHREVADLTATLEALGRGRGAAAPGSAPAPAPETPGAPGAGSAPEGSPPAPAPGAPAGPNRPAPQAPPSPGGQRPSPGSTPVAAVVRAGVAAAVRTGAAVTVRVAVADVAMDAGAAATA